MEEITFWEIIENCWSVVPEEKRKRMTIAVQDEYIKSPNEIGLRLEKTIWQKVFPRLENKLRRLGKKESYDFNKILECKLYELDRKDIHNYIGGSDDGFLYHRGFIVGMGKEYYYSILHTPSKGTSWLSSEDFAYMTRAIYHKLHVKADNMAIFNEGISRETGSNKDGWK